MVFVGGDNGAIDLTMGILEFLLIIYMRIGGSNRDAQPASLEKRGGRTPSSFHLITHLITNILPMFSLICSVFQADLFLARK